MRFDQLTGFFEHQAELFLSGDLKTVATHYTVPVAMYFETEVMVLGTRSELIGALSSFRDELVHSGIVRVQPDVRAVELTRGAMQQVWLEFSYCDATGTEQRRDALSYIISGAQDPDTARIEMVSYSELAYPALLESLPLAR